MFSCRFPLILASSSPRRQQYLHELGLIFSIIPAQIDETSYLDEDPEQFALRMATSKAGHIAQNHPSSCIIGADTVVGLDRQIFGKPRHAEEALAVLKTLQGKTHQVTTGVSIMLQEHNIAHSFAVSTQVRFGNFADSVLKAYVASGDPMDKAGAYGMQSQGSFLVEAINGSYSNVIGLPVSELIITLLSLQLLQPSSTK